MREQRNRNPLRKLSLEAIAVLATSFADEHRQP